MSYRAASIIGRAGTPQPPFRRIPLPLRLEASLQSDHAGGEKAVDDRPALDDIDAQPVGDGEEVVHSIAIGEDVRLEPHRGRRPLHARDGVEPARPQLRLAGLRGVREAVAFEGLDHSPVDGIAAGQTDGRDEPIVVEARVVFRVGAVLRTHHRADRQSHPR